MGSDQRKRESQLTVEAEMAVADRLRIVKDDASRSILLSKMLDSSKTYLESIGFLTTSTIGTVVINQRHVELKTSDYIYTLDDGVILGDTTSGAFNLTLPKQSTVFDAGDDLGQIFTAKLINGANDLTLLPEGTSLIDGSVSFVMTGGSLTFVTVIPDGTNWHIIGG